jgi:Tfp pilus assembly protein PilO
MDKLNINLERMSMGLVPSNEMAPKIEDINRIVAGTNFKFEPMKKPETVVKPFQDKAPT